MCSWLRVTVARVFARRLQPLSRADKASTCFGVPVWRIGAQKPVEANCIYRPVGHSYLQKMNAVLDFFRIFMNPFKDAFYIIDDYIIPMHWIRVIS
jgi:hypothetical protein